MGRPTPIPDSLTAAFWEGSGRGELLIQQCGDCSRYWHPPVEYCTSCQGSRLHYSQVSGRGRIYSYTEAHTGARLSYFATQMPYLIALVELEEQEGLLLYTNLPGAVADDIRIGDPVHVVFENIGDNIALPQFVVDKAGEGAR